MNLNQEQRKHVSNVMHTLAIALVFPAFLNFAGLSGRQIDNAILVGMFITAVVLEYQVIKLLGIRSKQDE